jgi:hypothetical protein
MDQPARALNPDPPEFSLGVFIETLPGRGPPFSWARPFKELCNWQNIINFFTENRKLKTEN